MKYLIYLKILITALVPFQIIVLLYYLGVSVSSGAIIAGILISALIAVSIFTFEIEQLEKAKRQKQQTKKEGNTDV